MRLRYKGRPLPRREWMNREPAVGDLRVEQLYDETLHRHIRIARVLNTLRPKDPDELPTLYDPVLLAMSPQAFSLTGFERIEGVDYAQSWLVMPAQRPRQADDGRMRLGSRGLGGEIPLLIEMATPHQCLSSVRRTKRGNSL